MGESARRRLDPLHPDRRPAVERAADPARGADIGYARRPRPAESRTLWHLEQLPSIQSDIASAGPERVGMLPVEIQFLENN